MYQLMALSALAHPLGHGQMDCDHPAQAVAMLAASPVGMYLASSLDRLFAFSGLRALMASPGHGAHLESHVVVLQEGTGHKREATGAASDQDSSGYLPTRLLL